MTHTPGPWRATSDCIISVRKDQRTTTLVADCKLSERRRKEGEANACLMAAAPDLLKELEELVDLVKAVREGEYEIDYYTTQPGLAAIDKARGRPKKEVDK